MFSGADCNKPSLTNTGNTGTPNYHILKYFFSFPLTKCSEVSHANNMCVRWVTLVLISFKNPLEPPGLARHGSFSPHRYDGK